MTLPIIIGIAVVAFLLVLCIIYFNDIKKLLKSKFSFKKKSKAKTEEKPKPKEDKKPTYSVEDFKPITKSFDDAVRDSSIESLFAFDEYQTETADTSNLEEKLSPPKDSTLTDADRKRLDDFFAKDQTTFKKINNKASTDGKSTISKQIKDLSPELKALLLDNVLKKRDDV